MQVFVTGGLLAQPPARVDFQGPQNSVLVARTMQLAAIAYAESGARLGTPLTYTVEPPALASVNQAGLLSGLAPGIVTVTARDAASGVSSRLRLEVRPLRIELEPAQLEVRIGDTARVSARAIDADGRPIPGQAFRYATSFAPVATVGSDGLVRPVAEGMTSLVAAIPGTGIAGTGTVRVLRRSDYSLRRLLDSRVSAPSAIVSVQEVTAAGARIAYLATLANGGQAAVLEENGRRRVLVAAGEYLPSIARLVVRLTNISINSRGDAAVLVEGADDPWCGTVLILFRAAGTIEEVSSSCGLFLHPHGLSETGNLTYQLSSGSDGTVREYSASGVTRTLFSMASRSPEMAEVTGLNGDGVSVTRFGQVLALVSTAKGTEAWHYNGERWQRVLRVGELVDGVTIQWVNNRAFGGSDGKFYTRFGENGILRMAPDQTKVFTKYDYRYANGLRQSSSHSVVDVLGDKVLINANLIKDDKNLTYLTVVSGDKATTLAETNWIIEGGGFLSDGRVAAVILDGNDLRPSILDGNSVAPLYTPGAAVSGPAAADWRYTPRSASGRALLMRGAGESLVEASIGASRALVSAGARLPGSGKPLIGLSAVASAANGTAAFIASFPAASGLYLWRNGELSLLIDTVGAVKGPGGAALNSLPVSRHRLLAVNARGETVFFGNADGLDRLMVIAPGESQARLVATMGAPLAGSVVNQVDQVAIDDDGRVSFIGRSNGQPAVYFWDRAKVEVIAQTAPATAAKPQLSDFFSISAAGREHFVSLNYSWSLFEVRSYDGARWADLTSTSDGRAGNLAIRGTYGPLQLARSCYLAQPLEGTVGAFCALANGRVAIVGRLGDRMPDGGTMLAPLGFSVTENGEVYLAAQVSEGGREFVALYLASPL